MLSHERKARCVEEKTAVLGFLKNLILQAEDGPTHVLTGKRTRYGDIVSAMQGFEVLPPFLIGTTVFRNVRFEGKLLRDIERRVKKLPLECFEGF